MCLPYSQYNFILLFPSVQRGIFFYNLSLNRIDLIKQALLDFKRSPSTRGEQPKMCLEIPRNLKMCLGTCALNFWRSGCTVDYTTHITTVCKCAQFCSAGPKGRTIRKLWICRSFLLNFLSSTLGPFYSDKRR